MVSNDLRLKMVSKAALYSYMKRKHVIKRRWFIAAESFGVASVIVLSAVLQVYLEIKPPTYKLDQATYGLIGESRDDTTRYLKEDKNRNVFEFTVPEAPETKTKEHTGRKDDVYGAIFSKQAEEGITYTDTASQIGVMLVPKFKIGEGRRVDGDHIVYSMGAQKLIYTLKYNGLKEDIVVPNYTTNELDYEFELSLPIGVEARLDSQGNIGIYSSDPSLFGNISFGSDEDRAKVDKARANGEKNNLVVTIPSPIVKDANGNEYNDRASFSLGEKQISDTKSQISDELPSEVRQKVETRESRNTYSLTLNAHSLKDLAYPISLDPTIQTSSAADWGQGNFEGGATLDTTNNLIKRSSLTGGFVNDTTAPWPTTTATITSGRWAHSTVAYNGYMYVIGGYAADGTGGILNTIQVGAIDSSTGDISSWSTASATLPEAREDFAGFTQNGYLYVVAGDGANSSDCVNNSCRSVYYSKINPVTGVLGTFASTTVMPTYLSMPAATVSGNYLYVSGGVTNGSGAQDDVYYAPLNADGTVGTWTTVTNSLPAVRYTHTMLAYNGYLYVLLGQSPVSTYPTSVYYNKVNSSTGALLSTSWIATTSFTTGSDAAGAAILGGYMYITGGCTSRDGDGDCLAATNRTQYAQINPDGTLGTWRSTTASASGYLYNFGGLITYNNRLYVAGGCFDIDGDFHCDSGVISPWTVYVGITPAGTTGTGVTETNTFTTGRMGHGTIVANGYIYVIGGCTVDQGSCDMLLETLTSTYYAPINSNGSIGSWTAGTTLPGARGVTSVAFNNNYIYVIAGSGGCGFLGTYSGTCDETFYASVNPSTGALSSWTESANPLPAARRRGAAASYGGYIYFFGGRDSSSTVVNTVYYASAGAGANGAWQSTSTMLTSRELLAATAYMGYMYIGSGYNGTTSPTAIEYAVINSNGTLGTFTNTSGIATGGRDGATMQVHNGLLYVAGGFSTSTLIEYAQVNSDGTLGTFASSLNGLTSAARRYAGAGGVHNGVLYIAGGSGSGGGSVYNSVESIPINNGGGGITGTWATTTALGSSRTYGSSIAANGYLYHTGGCTSLDCSGNTDTSTVQYTQILANGTLATPWTTAANSLNTARRSHGMAYVDGYLYVIGGLNSTGANLSLEYSLLDISTGAPSVWSTDSTSITAAQKYRAGVVSYGGYIYVVGGMNNAGTWQTATQYAKTLSSGGFETDSGCGSKWCSGTSLPVALTWVGVATNKDQLYVTGGHNSSSVSQSTVYRATLSASGIGAWATSISPLLNPRARHLSFIQNGYIYVVNGANSTITCMTSVEYAPLLAGGEVGPWKAATSTTEDRSIATGAYYNGNVYSVSGQDCSGVVGTVDRASLQSIHRFGAYSRLMDFGSGVKPTKLITRGTKQSGALVRVDYKNVNNASTSFTNGQSITDTGYTGANAQTFNLGSGITLSRYLWLRYVLDESNSGVFPDSGNETTVTDFDTYFTANPGSRLRGGRTFVNGQDRGLGVTP